MTLTLHNRRSRPAGRRAFTLIELLIALTISALLVASTVAATHGLADSREKLERRTQQVAAARTAMEAMVADLRNVRIDPEPEKPLVVGTQTGEFGGSGRIDLRLIGDRRCRREGAESDQYEVSYFLGKIPGHDLPALMRRYDHALDEYPDDGGIVRPVAEGVTELSFTYQDRLEEWVEEWSEEMMETPVAVRVTVGVAAEPETGSYARPEVMRFTTVVALRRVYEMRSAQMPQQEHGEEQAQQQLGGDR